MTCPRGELGTAINIRFIDSGKIAILCDVCEALWLEGEESVLQYFSYTRHIFINGDKEYTIDTTEKEDQEHRPTSYKNFK
jgi:hypothetical protein